MPTLQVACNAKLEEERVDQLVGDLVDLVVLYTSTPRHFVSVLVLQE